MAIVIKPNPKIIPVLILKLLIVNPITVMSSLPITLINKYEYLNHFQYALNLHQFVN